MLLVNRYYAWYTETGQTDIIPYALEREMLTWRRAFRKLILMSEYGCDAVPGMHSDPPSASWLKAPSALSEDSAKCARLVAPRARAGR